jgi:hypothetical protein
MSLESKLVCLYVSLGETTKRNANRNEQWQALILNSDDSGTVFPTLFFVASEESQVAGEEEIPERVGSH